MSEYQDKSAIGKMTGGVPIYVGFDQEGTLTEPVRRKPYLVLLLDEIEKAHRDLYSLLLQVMDYGKLKDGHGRKIDFVNVLLIMTTNVGAKEASAQAIVGDSVGKSKQKTPAETAKQTQDRVIGAAQKVFSPEFLNRLDLMLVFPALTHEDIVGITKQQVVPLVQQLAETKGIELVIDPLVVDYLAVEGYSTEFGARQLARKIMQLIKVPLADRVLAKEFGQGDKVEAFMNKGAVDFRKIA
jgi:ATP-dependent Clp protease ATP-binding subunit ClpC